MTGGGICIGFAGGGVAAGRTGGGPCIGFASVGVAAGNGGGELAASSGFRLRLCRSMAGGIKSQTGNSFANGDELPESPDDLVSSMDCGIIRVISYLFKTARPASNPFNKCCSVVIDCKYFRSSSACASPVA